MNRLLDRLRGRSRRREYWLFLLVLIAAQLALRTAVSVENASLITLPLWVYLAGRRLHDVGLSAWWGLTPFCLGFLSGFTRAIGVELPISAAQAMMIVGGFSIVMTILLGVWPGNRQANRFGPPPGKAFSSAAEDVFD